MVKLFSSCVADRVKALWPLHSSLDEPPRAAEGARPGVTEGTRPRSAAECPGGSVEARDGRGEGLGLRPVKPVGPHSQAGLTRRSASSCAEAESAPPAHRTGGVRPWLVRPMVIVEGGLRVPSAACELHVGEDRLLRA